MSPLRAAIGLLAASVLVASNSWIDGPGASAQEEPTPLAVGALGLELVDHSIDVEAGGDLVLSYRITGQLADVELLFIDQGGPAENNTTTIPPTLPPTLPPTTTTPDAPATPDEPEPPTTSEPTPPPTAPPTTLVPEPPPEPVTLSVDVIVDDPLDEVADLIGRLGPNVSPDVFQDPIDGVQLADVRPEIAVAEDGTAILELTLPTDTSPSEADRLGLDTPGVYPLLVALRVDGTVVARHGTIAHRVGTVPAAATVGLSAMTAIPQPRNLADDDELDRLVDRAARISEFADQTDMPLLASLPPDVVTTLVEGTSAGALVPIAFRDDAMQSLPATPFDISSAVAVERDEAFVRQLTAGEAQLQSALPGVPVRRDVWFVDRPLSSEAAELLRTLGVRALAMTPEVARTTLAPLPADLDVDRTLAVPLADGVDLPVLLLDAADDRFGTAATDRALLAGTATEWAVDHLARLRLDIEEDAADGEDPFATRGRVLTADDLGPLDPRLLDELVRLDARTTVYDVTDPATLATTVRPQPLDPAPTLPDEAGPSLAGRLDDIEQTRLVLANASSMLPDDDERAATWSQVLDALVSTAYTDDEATTALTSLQSEAERLTSSIVPPEPFSLTFTSRNETVPLTIGNTSDEPLRVRLELSSERLRFPEGDPEVLLRPNGTTDVEIPVEALTNGTTSMEVAIVTPIGGPIGDPVRVTTRVQALSGLAQLVTATLLLLLLTWWLSHWRANRTERERAARSAATTGTQGPLDSVDP